MFADYPSLDVEKGLLTCQNYDTFSREEITAFFSENYTDKLFSIAGKLQSLNLTDDQVNILRAYVIFNPGKSLSTSHELCFFWGRRALQRSLLVRSNASFKTYPSQTTESNSFWRKPDWKKMPRLPL